MQSYSYQTAPSNRLPIAANKDFSCCIERLLKTVINNIIGNGWAGEMGVLCKKKKNRLRVAIQQGMIHEMVLGYNWYTHLQNHVLPDFTLVLSDSGISKEVCSRWSLSNDCNSSRGPWSSCNHCPYDYRAAWLIGLLHTLHKQQPQHHVNTIPANIRMLHTQYRNLELSE